MTDFTTMTRSELQEHAAALESRFAGFLSRRLSLDMTRGKPCPEQLDLGAGLLDCLARDDYRAADGTDCRNYGGLDGLPEARALCAELLDVETGEVLVGGNSSLTLMHDAMVQALLHGVPGGDAPWQALPVVKFLCPSPGYDRHFAICQGLGIEMIPVAMEHDGPDMGDVERHVANDPAVKGMWCVPKYSNPTGVTYSDEVIERLARMHTAAPDFRIFCDNAYAVHDLTDTPQQLRPILPGCKAAGHPDRILLFGSTSKISFAGAGIAMVAGSEANIRHLKRARSIQTIGPDKLNQLRHVRLFKNMAGITAHMKRQAAILRPKFDTVLAIFDRELGGKQIAQWSRPQGGYFISVDTMDGCATAVVAMAAEAGVKLTEAGATFPYGRDPRDRNIRLAPSLPSLEEIEQAMELVAVCIQRVSITRMLRI